MDQVEQIITAVSQAVSRNTIYTAYEDQWRYLLESYLGSEEYRNAEHLVKYQLENRQEYAARLASTPLDNQVSSVIAVYNSFLFRTPPERKFEGLENIPELEDFLYDCDMDGQSLDSFMKDVSTWASVFGHCWVMVTKPNVTAQTRAEEMSIGIRPYLSYMTPLVVLDWNWSRQETGRYELTHFKYIEEVNGDVQTIRKWTKDVVKTYIVDVKNEEIIEQYEEINNLGKIPAVCVYNKRGIVKGIGVSDVGDIADHQRFIYNCYSEILQSIQMDTHPSLVATPETRVGTGSGALIHMPENLDPALKPYLLEFSGAGIDKILSSIDSSVQAIEKMANIGAIRGTEARRMSGVAQQQEFNLLAAKLSEKADNIELAEEQIWTLFAEYMGTVWNGSVDYPDTFNISDTRAEIEELKIASEIAGDDSQLQSRIKDRLRVWLGDEEMIHPVTTQQNRQPHINEMIMEGYTDNQILETHPEINQTDIDNAKQALLNSNGGQ